MFVLSNSKRHERRDHRLKSTALLAAVLVVANVAVFLGIGATARADTEIAAIPYSPLAWEKPRDDTAQPRSASIRVPSPIIQRHIGSAMSETHRKLIDMPVSQAGNRHLLIAIILGALGLMAGVSAWLFRTLAREVEQTEERRRNRLH